jgi:hypothetical protein
MNFRLILLILLVLIFTICGIYISVLSFEATSLQESYQKGDVEIIQNTTPGSVPHIIQFKNNGKKPLMVETGQILTSNTSQDMVVAEDKMVNQNSSSYISAYCFQPNQTATLGAKLTPSGKASAEIYQLIKNSNLADAQNSTSTQLQIWIIVSGDNLNLKTGEATVLIEKQGINNTEINNKLNDARTNLVKVLNLTEGELKNLSPQSPNDVDLVNWINVFINWFKNSFNIS